MGFFKSLFKAVGTVVGAVVGFMVAGPVGAVIGAGLGYAGGGAVADIVSYIFNPGFDVPDADANQNQGVTINKDGTNNNIPVVYGQRYIGGSRVAVATSGSTNEYLWIVLALAEGEINAVKNIYVDDTLAWEGTSTHGGQYEATKGKFPGYLTFQIFHGRQDQTVSTLAKQFGAGWTDNHRLRGIAYIVARCKWYKIEKTEDQDKTPWKGGIPNITATIQGKKVALCSSFASTITRSTTYENESITYSTNPVDCLLDYLRNPIYGKGLSNDKIDFLSFKTEAARINKLDDGSTAPDELRQECNGIIFTDRTIMANIKTMLFNVRAAMPFSQGRFKISLNDNRDDTSRYGPTATPVMSFDHDDIIGTVVVNAETNQSKYNRVIITYMGGGQQDLKTYEPIEYTWPEPGSSLEATFLDEDNGRINEQRLTYEHVTQDAIAKKIAQVALSKSRYRSKTIGFTVNARAQALEINDIVEVYYLGLGINGKFRVSNITMNNDYTFSIVAEEHNDLMYSGNPLEYVRKIHRSGQQGTTPEPVYYINDPVTGPDYSDPKTWDDLVNDPVYDTPEDVLDDIGNGDIIVDQPVDIYTPSPQPTTIDTPAISQIEIRKDNTTDTSNTGQFAELRFKFDPTTNPLIKGYELWYRSPTASDYVQTGNTQHILDAANGSLIVYHWPKASVGYFAIKLKGDIIKSGLSNGIYINSFFMENGGTVTREMASTPPPEVPLPVPFLSSVSWTGSGSSQTMTVNWTPIQDARIKDIVLEGSRWGTGTWLTLKYFQGYDGYSASDGTATLNWSGGNATDWSFRLLFDPDPILNVQYGLTPSNQIFVLTTDQVDGNSIDYTQSEPFKVPDVPIETPVVSNISITATTNFGFTFNFTPPTDERVIDAEAFWFNPATNFTTRLLAWETDLDAGTLKIGSVGNVAGKPLIIGRTTPGFYFIRFKMAKFLSVNANGEYSANSNQIYIEEYDWDSLPTTVTRDYKPAPRPLPIPVLSSVDVLTPTVGGTNRLQLNVPANADSRLYKLQAEYKNNNTGAWTYLGPVGGATQLEIDALDDGYLQTQSLTVPVNSGGAMIRGKYIYNSGAPSSYEQYSNEIWVTRTQLNSPTITGITTTVATPVDPNAYTFYCKSIYCERSTLKNSAGQYYTKLTFNWEIPFVDYVTGFSISHVSSYNTSRGNYLPQPTYMDSKGADGLTSGDSKGALAAFKSGKTIWHIDPNSYLYASGQTISIPNTFTNYPSVRGATVSLSLNPGRYYAPSITITCSQLKTYGTYLTI